MANEPIKSLTISIPAYNDSQSLIKLVDEAQALCTRLSVPFNMLIVNDGSQDDTLKVANKLAHQYNNITVLSHDRNLGFGETLKEVFMIPKTEWVLFLPGDNQFPASNLLTFLKIKDEYDYILGYRKDRQDAFYRKMYARAYNWVISTVSGFKVKDANSIVFYRSDIFDTIKLKGNSGFVHAEFFIRASNAKFRIGEIEIVHQQREFGFGSGGNVKVVAKIMKDLFIYVVKEAPPRGIIKAEIICRHKHEAK